MSDYIDRGMRRARATTPPVCAAECRDEEGRFARFGVQTDGGVITAIGFRASPCATLVAYCELAAERASGRPLAAAIRSLLPPDLALALPAVPVAKHDRARLAARALTIAILEAAKDAHP
jgi:hypothetical protein